jgi:hypothetical protein
MLLVGIGLARWFSNQNRRDNSRSGKTFRPRRPSPFSNHRDSADGAAEATAATDIYAMSRSSVTSVCDALTGAPIDTQAKVWRCVKCQSLYHHASVTALEKDNDGECIQCNSKSRAAVTFTDE